MAARTIETQPDGTLHRALMARALGPAATPEERGVVIDGLLELAGGRAEPLEGVRRELWQRLTHRRDDEEATHALRLVDGALAQVDRPVGGWSRQVRSRRRGRRRP